MDHPLDSNTFINQTEDAKGRLLQFEDGSVSLEDYAEPAGPVIDPNDHYQNLASVLPPFRVSQIGYELKLLVEEDIESQTPYYTAIADAIKLLGINISDGNSQGDDTPFDGASQIYSSALLESLLDMVATAINYLFPTTGITDSIIMGKTTPEKIEKALRKKNYFNHYFTSVAKEFKKEMCRSLLWADLGGSCYRKVFIDPVLNRPTAMFINPQDFVVNAAYTTHLVAPRKTHILRLSPVELKTRIISGHYRDRDNNLMNSGESNYEESELQEELDAASGIDRSNYTNNNISRFFEIHTDYSISEDPLAPPYDLPMPYIITVERDSGYVVRISRNWEPGDFLRKRREYFTNYYLLPSFEGEGYGLIHYGGKLAEAATSMRRQLINAAIYSNFPGGVYAAGVRIGDNNIRPQPAEFVPLQTGGLSIKDVISPLPYKEPSPALFSLLQEVEESIKRPSAIINHQIAEMTPKAPMGSVLAMLENLQKIPNSILQGFRESFEQELQLWNDCFKEWLQTANGSSYSFKIAGEEFEITVADFDDDVRIVPASNAAMQNSTYRFMQSEIILDKARQDPQIHNLHFAYEYFYKNMGMNMEDIQQLLPPPPPPESAPPPFTGDPVTENTYLMTHQAVKAELQQAHDAHIVVHQLVLANPQTAPELQQATVAHIQEHEAMKLFVNMQAQMHMQLPAPPSMQALPAPQAPPQMPGMQPGMPGINPPMQQGQGIPQGMPPGMGQPPPQQPQGPTPTEIQNHIAVKAAEVAQQQLSQMQGGAQSAQPMDPSAAAIEIEQLRTQQRRESDMGKLEIEKVKLALEDNKFKSEMALEEMRLAQDRQSEMLQAMSKERQENTKAHNSYELEKMRQAIEYAKLEMEQIRDEKDRLHREHETIFQSLQAMNDSAAEEPVKKNTTELEPE